MSQIIIHFARHMSGVARVNGLPMAVIGEIKPPARPQAAAQPPSSFAPALRWRYRRRRRRLLGRLLLSGAMISPNHHEMQLNTGFSLFSKFLQTPMGAGDAMARLIFTSCSGAFAAREALLIFRRHGITACLITILGEYQHLLLAPLARAGAETGSADNRRLYARASVPVSVASCHLATGLLHVFDAQPALFAGPRDGY